MLGVWFRFSPNRSCPEASHCARFIGPSSAQHFQADSDPMQIGSRMSTGKFALWKFDMTLQFTKETRSLKYTKHSSSAGITPVVIGQHSTDNKPSEVCCQHSQIKIYLKKKKKKKKIKKKTKKHTFKWLNFWGLPLYKISCYLSSEFFLRKKKQKKKE